MTRAWFRALPARVAAMACVAVAGSIPSAHADATRTAAPQVAPATAAVPAAPAATGYTYNPEGRRDPFVSLLHRGNDTRAPAQRPDGIGGITVDEIALRGIVQSRGRHVAMIQAPDGKSYTVRAGDRLLDGSVKAITAEAVVFVQQVDDPLSLVKQREIRKLLRPTEEGK